MCFVVGWDWWGRSGNGVDENPRSKYLEFQDTLTTSTLRIFGDVGVLHEGVNFMHLG